MSAPEKPNFLWSIFTMKCPRCRRGRMFSDPNPWKLRTTLRMPDKCQECGQPFKLEVGFWYGTGYVSYGLCFLFSVLSFLGWWLIIGISTDDYRLFAWLAINGVMLIILQPWIMRLSRAVYLYIFVGYDRNYKTTQVKNFDYDTDSYFEKGSDSDNPKATS
jgi:hypothetical protein